MIVALKTSTPTTLTHDPNTNIPARVIIPCTCHMKSKPVKYKTDEADVWHYKTQQDYQITTVTTVRYACTYLVYSHCRS